MDGWMSSFLVVGLWAYGRPFLVSNGSIGGAGVHDRTDQIRGQECQHPPPFGHGEW